MASPAKIAELLPDTLPEDFGDWDDEGSPSTQSVRLACSDHGPGPGVVPEPTTQPAESHGTVTAPGNLLLGAALPASAPEFVEDAVFLDRLRSLSPALDRRHETVVKTLVATRAIEEVQLSAPRPNGTAAAAARKATPAPQAAAMTEADELLFHFFPAETAEPKAGKKKRHIIAGTGAALVVVLAVAMISVLSHRTTSSVHPVAAPRPAVTEMRQPENATLKPTHSTRTTSAPIQPAAAAKDAQHSSGAEPTSDRENARPSRAQAQIMNDQLNAPARIHLAAAPVEQPPPPSSGFAAADMGGSSNNNAIGSVFSSAKQPGVGVASPKVVTVSSGVTSGLLIQSRPPVYPTIAKAARVSGTVVLAATISKTGTIKSLRVVSGSDMLRESAVDAVRTWRFKPYKLDNQPTEIETTINVTFSLDN